jgi:hypothetical protein
MHKHAYIARPRDRGDRRRLRRAVFPLIATGLAIAIGVDVVPARGAAPTPCADVPVTVTAVDGDDAGIGCRGAGLAIAFLAERGFAVRTPIVAEVVGDIDIIPGASVLGFFDPSTDVVKVLARSAFSSGTTGDSVLGLPMDETLYTSIFAHEVAHAVIYQNLGGRKLPLAAHEYLAYAVQLATLPPSYRKPILARFPGAGFADLEEVSELALGFDPDRFAVKAYLHFRNRDDQDAVLRRLLADFPTSSGEWY